MNKMKNLLAALLFATLTTPALAAVTDNQVFTYAEGNYASLFSGASQSGQFQQYNYRYYSATKNYLAVDSAKVIHILGPASNNAIQSVGPVSAFEGLITAWEAKQLAASVITPGAGTSNGKVCVADAAFNGSSIAKFCYTNLTANFNCSQTGIQGAGGSMPTSVGSATFSFSLAAACPANATMSFDVSKFVGGAGGGTGTSAPAAPRGVTATVVSSNQISINWTNVTGAATYHIYRSTSPNVQTAFGNMVNSLTSQPAAGPFLNTGLTGATTYYYTVTAINSSGESVGSTEVSATTFGAPSISGISPTSGIVGSAVSITGSSLALSNFLTTPTVKFNTGTVTTPAVPYTWGAGYSSIDFTVPRGLPAGSYSISLYDANGTLQQTAGLFTVPVVGNQLGGARQGTPMSLTPTVSTLAGTPTAAGGYGDAIGAAASFKYPSGITSDGTNLYIADALMTNPCIRQIVIATGKTSTIAGTCMAAPRGTLTRNPTVATSVDGTGSAATFLNIGGITTDGANLYVTDITKIRRVVIATGVVTTLTVTGIAAPFNYLTGITTDGTNLYVVDNQNQNIHKIVITTGAATLLAGAGVAGFADGQGAAAKFFNADGITTDGANLYVADTLNGRIRKIVIASGAVTTVASGISSPSGITTDGANLYVSDTTLHIIDKVVIATGQVTTLAGSPGASGNTNSPGARFNLPKGVTTDGTNLYVADGSNHTIRMIK